MYPIKLPYTKWLRIVQAFATSNTPNLNAILNTGIIPNVTVMAAVQSELIYVLLNGNPALSQLVTWIRQNLNTKEFNLTSVCNIQQQAGSTDDKSQNVFTICNLNQEISFSVLNDSILTAPTGLSAIAAGTTGLNLSWVGTSGAYILQRTSDCVTWTSIASPSVSSYSDTGLTLATANYGYRVCAYNAIGASAWSPILFVPHLTASTVTIDSAWLAANGPEPWILPTANTTYLLAVDVTALDTAFLFGGNNIILDGNGHTINYSTRALPPIVVNGYFEIDTHGWDITGAPGAIVAPSPVGMLGNQSLMLTCPTVTPQTVTTATDCYIPITEINRDYVATVLPKSSSYLTTVTLNVIDTVTGLVLGTAASRGTNRGFACTATFTPTTTNPVKLQIVVVPDITYGTDTVYLDHIKVFVSEDFGVVMTPASWYMPTQLKGITAISQTHTNGIIRNVKIVQGQAKAYGGSAIYCVSMGSPIFDNVTTNPNSMDTSNIEAEYAGNVICINSDFAFTRSATESYISDRMLEFGAIDLKNNYNALCVDNCTIDNVPQSGIVLLTNLTGPIALTNNKIRINSRVTDGYCILVEGIKNAIILNNHLDPYNGRGMMVDAYGGTAVTDNVEIGNNYVTAYELPNLEYGATGISPTALRIRTFEATEITSNLNVHDNIFIATVDDNSANDCIGLFYTSPADGKTAFDNRFTGNLFKAIVNSTSTSKSGKAISLSGIDAGTRVIFAGNILESNDVALNITDLDSWEYQDNDVLFQSNTIVKSADGPVRNFKSIQIGIGQGAAHNIRMIDTKYAGGATQSVTWLGFEPTAFPSDIEFGNLLELVITHAGTPAVGVVVTITDSTGTTVFTGTTDASGILSNILLVDTRYDQLTSDPTKITTTSKNPFNVSTVFNGNTVNTPVTMSGVNNVVTLNV